MKTKKKIHFVGIGGVGMSGIAKILIRSGYEVSGSDLRENQETRDLKDMGATIYKGHHGGNLKDANVVVYSSAVEKDNPELIAAKEKHLLVMARAEMLGELMRKKRSIVVAGAHGKTTTSALITTLLLESGFDPTAVIGGRLRSIAGNAKMGTDDWFVCESDESDGSFLKLLPEIAVITNVDREHMNHYGTFEAIEKAFLDFANRVPFDGLVIICADDIHASKLISKTQKSVLTYGIENASEVTAKEIKFTGEGMSFSLRYKNKTVANIQIPLFGRHNVLNSLAVCAVGLYLELSGEQIAKALGKFAGIERRLERKGEAKGVAVMDDYAHHPTEIRASIQALQMMPRKGKLRILFQPHRYSRVRDLWDDFCSAFDQADELVLVPIYAASETAIEGIDHQRLTDEISRRGKITPRAFKTLEEATHYFGQEAREGDIVVTMGAGDVTKVGPALLSELNR